MSDINEDLFCIKYTIGEDKLSEFEEFIKLNNANIIFDSCYNSETEFVITLNIPDDIKYDFDNFKTGKFSHFKYQNKFRILRFLKKYNFKKTLITDVEGILDKSKTHRKKLEDMLDMILPDDIELSSIPTLKHETLILEEYDKINY